VGGEYATSYRGFRVSALFDQRRESSRVHFSTRARVSELEVISFHGLGNQSPDSSAVFYEVRQRQWQVQPIVGLALGNHGDLSLGPILQYTTTDSVPAGSFPRRAPMVRRVRPGRAAARPPV
jgi:hypothetical protein